MAAERRFRAMGSDAHVVVVSDAALLDLAQRRVDDLESRWSRFLPTSEVSRLTAFAGTAVAVSPETALLVRRSVEAWQLSGGSFDPTVLGAVVRAGYDRSFERVADRGPVDSPLVGGCVGIEADGTSVRLPEGTGFDPGGIGKGLAADIVATELLAAGAEGACVNLGGDVRVTGTGPTGGPWTVDVEHPRLGTLALLGVAEGGVATSTTLRRRWTVDGDLRHHLIDPGTGLPSDSDLDLAAVVAREAWVAEVLAKAVLLRGRDRAFQLLGGTGAEALAAAGDEVLTSPGLPAFLSSVPRVAEGAPVHDDEIPTRPPTFDEPAGPPPMSEPAAEAPPAPAAAAAPTNDVRTWVGAGIGIVAIALAALIGTGVISSDASTGGRGGPGGFRGNGGPPPFNGGGGFPGGGQFNGGQLNGGPGFPGGGQFQQQVPQVVVPSTPSTTTPKADATLS